ncbi:MAG: enoyl-CoA hydratase/isomerase family protein [Thermoleophilia bacterium]|nr:enoyl-CoA hydratase/isomerase family protein [Thermoleophilia bacterium]
MSYKSILYELDDAVALITLNRPETLNAISAELERELHHALQTADEDARVRAVVLTGAGRAFCVGYDMGDAEIGPAHPDPESPGDYVMHWYGRNAKEIAHLRQIWSLGTPVIAAINGYCMGGGLWYALACDISLASTQAVFGQPEVRGIASTTFLLAALAGWKAANRYGLTGDHFDAAEALRLGVVNEVVAPEELLPAATALARRIARVPEASVRINKAITMLGLSAAGVETGLTLNGALNAVVHSVYGRERQELDRVFEAEGLRAMLQARDTPFLPEPFGPRAAPRETAEDRGRPRDPGAENV